MSISLIEILENNHLFQPIKLKKETPLVLDTVEFLARVTQSALGAFQAMKVYELDALVGENACQYRAARNNDLAILYLNNEAWRHEVAEAKLEAERIMQTIEQVRKEMESQYPSNKEFKAHYPTGTNALALCQIYDLCPLFSDSICYLIESYLLTQTKALVNKNNHYYQKDDVTKAELLAKFAPPRIQRKKLIAIVAIFQKDLAARSLHYLKKEVAELLPSKENLLAQKMIQEEEQSDDFSRPCIPCFYGLESLVQRIAAKGQYLLIDCTRWLPAEEARIDRIKRVYAWKEGWQPISTLPPSHPVVVIAGYSLSAENHSLSEEAYVDRLNSYRLEEILNANWAQHTQYPGRKLREVEPPPDERREALAIQAHEMGCGTKNPSLFLVNHILCDTYQHALENQEML